jgi:hypothetical protein
MKVQISKFFKDSIVFFLAGVILSAAVEIAIDVPAQRYIGIFIAFVSLFIVYVTITLVITHRKMNEQLDQLGLASLLIYEPTESTESFVRAMEIVRAAKHQVLVLSHYVPSSSTFQFPETRKDYLVRGIEQQIKLHLENPAAPKFTYKRIVQSSKAEEANRLLRQDLIPGDVETFEHCGRVFELIKNRRTSNVDIEFRISEPVYSMPSMMVVDSKYVLFAMSTKPPRLSMTHKQLEFAGSLIIEDRDGKAARGFESIFERLLQNSFAIESVEDKSLTLSEKSGLTDT